MFLYEFPNGIHLDRGKFQIIFDFAYFSALTKQIFSKLLSALHEASF